MVREYTQTARAESTRRTRREILDAAQALFREDFLGELSLQRVAERAGCSTRTILRQFGSRDGLIGAAILDAEEDVMAARSATGTDVAADVGRLIDHYEESGDEVMRWLAAGEANSDLRRIVDSGKDRHLDWARLAFKADLAGLSRNQARERLAVLASVTDVYMWELLRRRHGLGRRAAESAILDLVEAARAGGSR